MVIISNTKIIRIRFFIGRASLLVLIRIKNMEKKILLVEDNEVNKMVALQLLQEKDYRVSIANNGQEALEMLDKEISIAC